MKKSKKSFQFQAKPPAGKKCEKPKDSAKPQNSDSDSAQISAEALCALTGLTDRRHRQIAKLGYFPPPLDGQYQQDLALQGLFRYYRELGDVRRKKRDEIDAEKLRKLKRENDEGDGRLADKEKLAEAVGPLLTSFRDLSYQKLENEIPMAMAGMDVPQARIIGRRYADELLRKLQDIFRAWKL